jgi:hypothetical protein
MTIFRAKRSIEQLLSSVDVGFLKSDSDIEIGEYLEPLEGLDFIDVELVSMVLRRGIEKFQNDEFERISELDQWLSPRIHSALRISRRVAGDMGFWTWLTIVAGREYTWKRWTETERPTMYRYTGDFKRNALARLWWFSEMSRNGPDYSPIKNVLRDPSTAQYAMELRYSMYRPAVIAFGNTAARQGLGFAAVKDLSKRVNAYLSLRALEAIGHDPRDADRDREWWKEQPSVEEVTSEAVTIGPRDSYASSDAIKHIEEWFDSLVLEGKSSVDQSSQ